MGSGVSGGGNGMSKGLGAGRRHRDVSETSSWAVPCEGEGQDVPRGRPVVGP